MVSEGLAQALFCQLVGHIVCGGLSFCMAFYQLLKTLPIPSEMDTIWNFISRPENLKLITPRQMGFEIVTPELPETMYPGMIIEYRVSPIQGFRQRWVTEISYIREGQYFVDEQRVGPYALWHHEHFIEPIKGGVLMKDIVSYKMPFGPIGILAHTLFVRRKLEAIFEYRKEAMESRFGTYSPPMD